MENLPNQVEIANLKKLITEIKEKLSEMETIIENIEKEDRQLPLSRGV